MSQFNISTEGNEAMKQSKSIDWRTIGNLVVVCFSLVNMSLSSAQAILRGDWLYVLMAVSWAMVAVVNIGIAISRIARQSRNDN